MQRSRTSVERQQNPHRTHLLKVPIVVGEINELSVEVDPVLPPLSKAQVENLWAVCPE
jgi:hypothetical protein